MRDGNPKVLHRTVSLCSVCRNGIPADIVALSNKEVWMRKSCSEHGAQQVRLSDNVDWYEGVRLGFKPIEKPPEARKSVSMGCPFDCGPCTSHMQKIRLPVVTINSSCNLDCPICYVHNKNTDPYVMKMDDFKTVVGRLKSEYRELDILNLTGGEPTLHPEFLDFLAYAKSEGIHRVTICTNGIKFVKDPKTLERMGEIGARVALSFDSFEKEADYALQGAKLVKLKMECLDLLEKHGVNTTLIPVMTKGVNDQEIGRMIQLLFDRPNIRHMEVHTITYTGQSGRSFMRSGRISMHEVLQTIEKTTEGYLKPADFVPSPCAHPLCYQIAYFLMDPSGGRPVPFTRFLSADQVYKSLADRLYLEPSPYFEGVIQDAIQRLWTNDDAESGRILGLLKGLLKSLFPSDRKLSPQEALAAAEKNIKAIYIHSHMDEETFDMDRAAQCCDSNCYGDGTSIPVCNYNVLYRDKEPHFNEKPAEWGARTGGVKAFPHGL